MKYTILVLALISTLTLQGCATMAAFGQGFSQGISRSNASFSAPTYVPPPAPVYTPPVNCTTNVIGTTAFTNCH